MCFIRCTPWIVQKYISQLKNGRENPESSKDLSKIAKRSGHPHELVFLDEWLLRYITGVIDILHINASPDMVYVVMWPVQFKWKKSEDTM